MHERVKKKDTVMMNVSNRLLGFTVRAPLWDGPAEGKREKNSVKTRWKAQAAAVPPSKLCDTRTSMSSRVSFHLIHSWCHPQRARPKKHKKKT